MFKDVDRTIIYYGVYDTDTEVFDETDILCTVRKKFFETRSTQKGRGNIKTAEVCIITATSWKQVSVCVTG